MAKDYFQDILPPGNDRPVPSSPPSTQSPPAAPMPQTRATPIEIKTEAPMPERSIRNIAVSSRPRPAIDIREPLTSQRPKPGRSRSTVVLWSVAGIAIVGLSIIGFVATRPTTVTITPRTHNVTFDQTSVFTAYPAQSAATGTLSYTVQKIDIEDSEAVASNGVTHVEEKASGSVTVYNDFATTPVKLVKNTRFATPDGLIFRTPADVVVPGKKGNTPGSVVITAQLAFKCKLFDRFAQRSLLCWGEFLSSAAAVNFKGLEHCHCARASDTINTSKRDVESLVV